jgi:membrane associated rhomboid family serine protease
MASMSSDPSLPAPPGVEHCYRHPSEETGVHCTRCGRPICPACMIEAPVGYQCPECVAEARQEFRKGPGRRIAVANAKGVSVTKVLLGLILGVFVIEVAVGGPGSLLTGPSPAKLIELGGSVPVFTAPDGGIAGIAAGQYWRIFTSMFLHFGLIHLAFNAYALWIFGTFMETELGRLRFALVYLVTGICAGAVAYAWAPLVLVGNQLAISVGAGASGAIFGVFGAFVTYNYRRRGSALAQARLRQAAVLLLLNAVIGLSVPAIDWRAHVGGFVSGLVAGYVAEGSGNLTRRRAILVGGMAGLLVAAGALAVWRTTDIRAMFPPGTFG